MKNKKALAIALSIGIFTSSFSGVFISYAKNDNRSDDTSYVSNQRDDENTTLAPTPIVTQLISEVQDQEILHNKNATADINDNGIVLYEGIKKTDNTKAIFNFNEKEVTELLSQGYSIQDLFEADDIGNQIYEDPIKLLNIKKESKKSLKEIKEDVLKERKETGIKYLKSKYQVEFDKLNNESLKDDEIVLLLSYVDLNDVQLTDDLIKQYKSKKVNVLKETQKKSLSEETKKKYDISNKDAELLTEDLIKMFETASKQLNKPVKELIKSYLKSNIK